MPSLSRHYLYYVKSSVSLGVFAPVSLVRCGATAPLFCPPSFVFWGGELHGGCESVYSSFITSRASSLQVFVPIMPVRKYRYSEIFSWQYSKALHFFLL